MFSIFVKLVSSLASFLFPVFASYKALKTSDPAQLTPWLMYWVVLSSAILVESWTDWFLVWIPFYAYFRFLFLLYLVLPQTQGARIIYQTYMHPYLEENETQIEEFISSAHDRLKAAGIAYLKRAIDLLKQTILGIQPEERAAAAAASPSSSVTGQSYTQSLLARFSVPTARWTGTGTGNTGGDFYNLLASAVSAAAGAAMADSSSAAGAQDNMSASGTLIPPTLRDTTEKMTFIAAQRERLNIVLTALDREARTIEREETIRQSSNLSPPSRGFDGAADDERPPSGMSMFSGLSKSRSEADFEKIDAESGAEEEANLRRRANASTGGGSWIPWAWGATTNPSNDNDNGQSSGVDN